jgi:hypothetical protein
MPSRKRSGIRLLESTSWVRFLPFSYFLLKVKMVALQRYAKRNLD